MSLESMLLPALKIPLFEHDAPEMLRAAMLIAVQRILIVSVRGCN